MHLRLVNVYLLNVPTISSPYFNKIKRTSRLREMTRFIARNSLNYFKEDESIETLVPLGFGGMAP